MTVSGCSLANVLPTLRSTPKVCKSMTQANTGQLLIKTNRRSRTCPPKEKTHSCYEMKVHERRTQADTTCLLEQILVMTINVTVYRATSSAVFFWVGGCTHSRAKPLTTVSSTLAPGFTRKRHDKLVVSWPTSAHSTYILSQWKSRVSHYAVNIRARLLWLHCPLHTLCWSNQTL